MVNIAIHEAYRLLVLGFQILLIFASALMPPAGNQPHTSKGQGAAPNKLSGVAARGALEVTVEDCRAKNYGQCEHDELYWDDLRGVEALESPVDVLDLHNSSGDQDGH
jgi:hypothetical protein